VFVRCSVMPCVCGQGAVAALSTQDNAATIGQLSSLKEVSRPRKRPAVAPVAAIGFGGSAEKKAKHFHPNSSSSKSADSASAPGKDRTDHKV